jgi:hypothetical protein
MDGLCNCCLFELGVAGYDFVKGTEWIDFVSYEYLPVKS